MTTNPSTKHMYCRNGPGYYVEVAYANEKRGKSHGFSLVFRDIDSMDSKQKPPLMVITKKPASEGGYLTISIPRQSRLRRGTILYAQKEEGGEAPLFNGLSIPKKLDMKYIPVSRTSQGVSSPEETERFRNYEFKDFNNIQWDIGAIPRVRHSRINRMKSRANDQDEEEFKFIGKRNIYFHRNYTDQPVYAKYRTESKNPEDVYLQDSDHSQFPPVLAHFRPYESKTRKKIINTFSRHFHPQNVQQFQQQQSRISKNAVEHDIAAGAIKNYFRGGDGLYFEINPADDAPDDNKVGWITVYEDAKLFSSRGMFDVVVGLTLAVGFEGPQ